MIKRGNLFMLILVLYMMAVGMILSFLRLEISSYYLNIFLFIISFGLPFLIYLKVIKAKPQDILPLKPLGGLNILLIICVSFLFLPLLMAISAVSSLMFDNNVELFFDEMAGYSIFHMLILVALLPAILEEIIFRGIVLSNLKNISIKKAACISGLFFALIHMDLQQFLYAFIMGIVFCYMTYYTKSIYAAVLSHFTINAAMVLLSYTARDVIDYFPIIPALIVSLPALIMALKYFISFNNKNVTDEIILYGNTTEKVLTWEFWVLILVSAIWTAALQF